MHDYDALQRVGDLHVAHGGRHEAPRLGHLRRLQHAGYHVGEVARQRADEGVVVVGGVLGEGNPLFARLVVEVDEDVAVGVSARDCEGVNG